MKLNKKQRGELKRTYKIRDKNAKALQDGNFKQQIIPNELNYERLRPQDMDEILLENEELDSGTE